MTRDPRRRARPNAYGARPGAPNPNELLESAIAKSPVTEIKTERMSVTLRR